MPFGQPSTDESAVPGWTPQGNAPLGYAQPNTGTFTQASVYPYLTPGVLQIGATPSDVNRNPGWQNQQKTPAGYNVVPSVPALRLVASTGVSGYPLINGTGTVISWLAPNDGLLHRFTIMTTLSITVTETGGNIVAAWFTPDGANPSATIYFGGTAGPAQPQPATWFQTVVKPGSVVAVNQSSALTAGAATLWAEIWGS